MCLSSEYFFNSSCKATCRHSRVQPCLVSCSPLSTLQITILLQKSNIVQFEPKMVGDFIFLTSFSLLFPLKHSLPSPFTDIQRRKQALFSSVLSYLATRFCKVYGTGLLPRNVDMILSLADDIAGTPVTKPSL